jgi:hypothetical protein
MTILHILATFELGLPEKLRKNRVRAWRNECKMPAILPAF